MQEWEQMEKPLHDLIEIIHFTEGVSARIHGLLDEAEIYGTVMEEFAQSKRYTASILLLTDDGSSLRIAETSLPSGKLKAGEKAAGVRLKGYNINLDKSSIYSQVVREGKTVQVSISDVIGELFPRPLAYLISKAMGYEKKPSILTPLQRRGKIIGALAISSTELAEHFIPSARSLARHISTDLELTDENARRVRAEEALERRVAELSALNAMAAIVNESLDVDEILNRAMDEALRLVGVEAAAMLLLDEEAGELALVAHRGVSDEFVRAFSRMKLGEGLAGRAAQMGEPIVMGDLAEYPEARRAYVEKERIRSAASVPLVGRTGVIGVMNLGAASPHYFDAAGLELLVALGRQIATGVEKARLSQETFRVVAENASDGILIAAGTGVHVYANKRAAEITGYSVAELLKTTIKDLVHPDELEKIVERYRKRLEGKPVPRQYETIIIRKDGQSVPIELTAAKTAWQGQPADMVIIRDITERVRAEEALRESEEKYRYLVEQANDGITIIQDTIVQYANPRLLEMRGGTLEEVIGTSFTNFIHPDELPKVVEHYKRRMAGESVVPIYETTLRRKNGERVQVELSTGVITYQGKPTDLVIIRDITERVRVEAALKEYSERLEDMVEERTKELREAQERLIRQEKLAVLGQLAGGMGHELRNPLGVIKNAAFFLNMALAEREPEPEVKETLEILEREVAASERIIGSLLDFARPKPPTRRKVEVNEVLREALSRTTVPEGIEVVSQLDEALPVILADPDQLAQVFGNIIRNGIQAMPRGGRLTVETSEVSDSPLLSGEGPGVRWVAVSITDTGVGIPEENLAKLFEPLFTTKAKGIGLGLAVTKTLVEGHGGSIEVESEVGKGTTFTVRLPIAG